MDTKNKLFLSEININAIDENLRYFCGFEKLSGEPEAFRAVERIRECLEQWEIPCRIYRFPALISNPVRSSLIVAGKEIASRPRSFSGCCKDLCGELVFDYTSGDTGASEWEKEAFYKNICGKIVIGFGFDERYGKVLEKHGAAAWIQVWKTKESLIHEDTVSPVWGTPDMDSRFLMIQMPVIGITRQDGDRLIAMLQKNPQRTDALLTVVMDQKIREVALPVAEICGRSEDFVMLSCHYDTWYIGAFDNSSANAAALEIARVLKKYQNELERSVRIAWWPGHSNGRYMGSTWYCDHFYGDLYHHCIASLNSDLIGAIDTDMVVVRTTGSEGKKWFESVKEQAIPGTAVRYLTIGRGADQSFFGTDIPYHINPRFEADEKRYATPGAGGEFWHTAEDTYDKIDLNILEKETRLLGLLVYELARNAKLPFDLDGYFDEWSGRVAELKHGAGEEAIPVLDEICDKINEVRENLRVRMEEKLTDDERTALIKRYAGTLNRLFHSSGSPYEQDTAFAYGSLHLIRESSRLNREEFPEALYLFYHTSLVRQRNRLITELENLCMDNKMRKK